MTETVNVRVDKPIHIRYKAEAVKQSKKLSPHKISTQGLINQVLAEKQF